MGRNAALVGTIFARSMAFSCICLLKLGATCNLASWRLLVPLRRLRNFATCLVALHSATIVYIACTPSAHLVTGASRTRTNHRRVVVGSDSFGKAGASTF